MMMMMMLKGKKNAPVNSFGNKYQKNQYNISLKLFYNHISIKFGYILSFKYLF